MKRNLWYVTISALAVLAMVVASGDSSLAQGGRKRVVRATLSGFQEDPVVSTTGRGSFRAAIADNETLIEYELSYEALEGTPTLFAHIHFGSHDHNGGIAVFLCGGGGKPACPNGSGFVSGIITASDVIGPEGQGIEPGAFQELVRAIRAGHTYVNVHTGRWPAGEIRGQINDDNRRD